MDRIAVPRRAFQLVLLALLLPAAVVLPAATADASLIFAEPQQTSGTGLGAVNTVLTVNGKGAHTVSGCVAWDGSADEVGPAACPTRFAGGDEHTQTQTRTLAEVGLTSAYNLRLVFNYNEPQSSDAVNDITVADLELTLYQPDGAVCFASGAFAPVTFDQDFGGIGKSGFVFRLDAQQAAAAQPCFADPQVRAGLAATLEGVDSGPETFFLTDAGTLGGPEADLALTKTDSPDPVRVGELLTYTLTVTNLGPNAASDVMINDTLPGSLASVTATSDDATCTVFGRRVLCAVGDLAPGETATVTIAGTPTVAGTITNTAVVSSDAADPNPHNDTAFVPTEVEEGGAASGNTGAVDLAVDKSDSPDPVGVGQTLTYTVVVRNVGLVTATGVTVTDTLPTRLDFLSAAVTTGAGSCTREGRTVVCELGDLAVGAEVVITLRGTATASGTLANTVQVSADQEDTNPADNTDVELTAVGSGGARRADLSVIKTASPTSVAVGQTITYLIVVSNVGPDAATGTELVELLPMGADLHQVVSSQGSCSHGGGVVTCALGTIQAGDTATVQVQVVPTVPGTLINRVVVSANESDDAVSDNTTEVPTQVQEVPFAVEVPTVGELGLALLVLLVGGAGAWILRRT